MTFAIIGKRFTPAEFAAYVEGIPFPGPAGFNPSFVVLHNTAVPSLAQRPDGFTEKHMEGLASYYSGLGWKGCPHLFIDDHGIWVLNPLNNRGTHSPSWNGVSLGVEMLGDYESESFTTGRGAAVRDNAVAAVAILCRKIGASVMTLRLHREDKATTHACPGKNVSKPDFISRVALYMQNGAAVKPLPWTVEIDDETIVKDCRDTPAVRAVAEALKATLTVDSAQKVITIHPAKGV